MSSSFQPLQPATLTLDDNQRPVSHQFGDIYYAGPSPLAQARQIFLGGNGLPQRWRARPRFTVLETGFGLGHNFLALWDTWRNDPRRCGRLHMVSIEAHPFTRDDLSRMYARLEASVQPLARELLDAWPVLTPGIHRLELDQGAVTLTLAFGPVGHMVRQLELGFDACFLDGFAPRVNPEMWTPEVFRQLARMANSGATLATWCSAGQVRRDLQNAGFLIERRTGFGNKRHSITGQLRPGMGGVPGGPTLPSVAIVGSGFSGAATAYALAHRGVACQVFDPALTEGPAGTHREHRQAAMTPVLSRDDDIRARLSRSGVFLALRRWQHLDEAARPLRCGAFEPLAFPDDKRWQRALEHLQLPAEYVHWVTSGEATSRTGVSQMDGGLWHGYGHQLRPQAFLSALLASSLISQSPARIERVMQNDKGQWLLYNEGGKRLACVDWVVIANSWLAGRLVATIPGFLCPRRMQTLHRVAGQLSYFSVARGSVPQSMIVGDGLCMPDGDKGLIGGSTYVTDTTLSIMTAEGHHENRKKVMALLGDKTLQLGRPRSMADGWSGWRAAVRDRLPVIGSIAHTPGLWLACGFGSRGLTWSALAGELLAARLNHEPIPLERGLLQKIAPL